MNRNSAQPSATWVDLTWDRPARGPLVRGVDVPGLRSELCGWCSNGGPTARHPHRTHPFTQEFRVSQDQKAASAIRLIGSFALWSSPDIEPHGTVGASITVHAEKSAPLSVSLASGVHYRDAFDLAPWERSPGDGVLVHTLGKGEFEDRPLRVDSFEIDLGGTRQVEKVVFRDSGSSAAFVVFEAQALSNPASGCPFHSSSEGVSLAALGSSIRLRNVGALWRAISQLTAGLQKASDLDEARSESLLFVAVVAASALEIGGGRELHRVQLETARRLDRAQDLDEVVEITERTVHNILDPLMGQPFRPTDRQIRAALGFVDQNFGKDLSDDEVAHRVGLSTSHFRYLFRQATGRPFQQYLLARRLEQARRLLIETDIPVQDIGAELGFSSLASFSRAFARHYGTPPSALRDERRGQR